MYETNQPRKSVQVPIVSTNRRAMFVPLVVFLVSTSGCLSPADPTQSSDPGRKYQYDWKWTIPDSGSSIFVAKLLVLPSSEDLVFKIDYDFQAPNRNGEALYVEAFWEDAEPGRVGVRFYTFLVPGRLEASLRIAGNDAFGPVEFPSAPVDVGNPGSVTHRIAIRSHEPRVLVVSGLAVRDLDLPDPFTVTVSASSNSSRPGRIHQLSLEHRADEVGLFFLDRGDFDGTDTTRARLGSEDFATTGATKSFETVNHTVIWVEGALYTGTYDSDAAPGSIRVAIKGSNVTREASAGGLDGGAIVDMVGLFRYGDDWTMDVEFSGTGYLFVIVADFPTIGWPTATR